MLLYEAKENNIQSGVTGEEDKCCQRYICCILSLE